MKVRLPSIEHDPTGFTALVTLFAETRDCSLEEIVIDMSTTRWLDADMCAAFGAILYQLGHNLNSIQLINLPSRVEKILSKNGFLSSYGRQRLPDTWGTTIPYERFEAKDDRYFAKYIETRLTARPEMPSMSAGLVKKFQESVFEIFSNAVIHSQSQLGIFSCGQYFPRRHRIDFIIADLGIGIRQNIQNNLGLNLTADEAIVWATTGQNTTKRGPIPGGLGLKLLKEFIALNEGKIQIVSDSGYWRLENSHITQTLLAHPFPGTVVSLEVNTADTKSYALSSEMAEADIF